MKNKFKEISEHFDKQLEYVKDYLYEETKDTWASEEVSWGDHLIDDNGDLYVEVKAKYILYFNKIVYSETHEIFIVYYKDIKDIKDMSGLGMCENCIKQTIKLITYSSTLAQDLCDECQNKRNREEE